MKSLKAVCYSLLLLAIGMVPSGSAFLSARLLPGGVWCNVTAIGEHTCEPSAIGKHDGAKICHDGDLKMTTTEGIMGDAANWYELPSEKNCRDYHDEKFRPCEYWADEPVTNRCGFHWYAWPF